MHGYYISYLFSGLGLLAWAPFCTISRVRQRKRWARIAFLPLSSYLALSCNVLPGHNSLVAVNIASQHTFDNFCFMKLLKTTVKHIYHDKCTLHRSNPRLSINPGRGFHFSPSILCANFCFAEARRSTTAARIRRTTAVRTTRIQFEQERDSYGWNWSGALYVKAINISVPLFIGIVTFPFSPVSWHAPDGAE